MPQLRDRSLQGMKDGYHDGVTMNLVMIAQNACLYMLIDNGFRPGRHGGAGHGSQSSGGEIMTQGLLDLVKSNFMVSIDHKVLEVQYVSHGVPQRYVSRNEVLAKCVHILLMNAGEEFPQEMSLFSQYGVNSLGGYDDGAGQMITCRGIRTAVASCLYENYILEHEPTERDCGIPTLVSFVCKAIVNVGKALGHHYDMSENSAVLSSVTSRNYCDHRITKALCLRHDVSVRFVLSSGIYSASQHLFVNVDEEWRFLLNRNLNVRNTSALNVHNYMMLLQYSKPFQQCPCSSCPFPCPCKISKRITYYYTNGLWIQVESSWETQYIA
jgi:hypothetical protein